MGDNSQNDAGQMTRRNWTVIWAGIGALVLGFAVLALVGKDYHGALGFFAPFLLVGGLTTVCIGLALPSGARGT